MDLLIKHGGQRLILSLNLRTNLLQNLQICFQPYHKLLLLSNFHFTMLQLLLHQTQFRLQSPHLQLQLRLLLLQGAHLRFRCVKLLRVGLF